MPSEVSLSDRAVARIRLWSSGMSLTTQAGSMRVRDLHRSRDGSAPQRSGVVLRRGVDPGGRPGNSKESLMTDEPSSRPTKAFWVQCIDRWPAEVLVYAEDAEAAKSLAAEDDGEEIRYGGERREVLGALRDVSRDRDVSITPGETT